MYVNSLYTCKRGVLFVSHDYVPVVREVFCGLSQVVLSLLTSVEVNSVSMAWMIPQYFVVTVGEVLFSITGLAFAYSQVSLSLLQLSDERQLY